MQRRESWPLKWTPGILRRQQWGGKQVIRVDMSGMLPSADPSPLPRTMRLDLSRAAGILKPPLPEFEKALQSSAFENSLLLRQVPLGIRLSSTQSLSTAVVAADVSGRRDFGPAKSSAQSESNTEASAFPSPYTHIHLRF